jgi:hypothetical protein
MTGPSLRFAMAGDTCDGCGKEVSIGGGIGAMWSSDPEGTGGLTLELADGTEHFLCFSCVEDLPDDREVTADDVESL